MTHANSMNEPPVATSRRRRLTLHLAACAALAAGVFVVGCKSDPVPTAQDLFAAGTARAETTIRSTVSDPERREQALRIIADYAADEREFLDGTVRIRDRIVALHRDYGTTREQYMVEVQLLKDRRGAFSGRLVSAWMSLTDVLEEDEEKALIALQLAEEDRWRTKIK